jgi:hypothetical protein
MNYIYYKDKISNKKYIEDFLIYYKELSIYKTKFYYFMVDFLSGFFSYTKLLTLEKSYGLHDGELSFNR